MLGKPEPRIAILNRGPWGPSKEGELRIRTATDIINGANYFWNHFRIELLRPSVKPKGVELGPSENRVGSHRRKGSDSQGDRSATPITLKAWPEEGCEAPTSDGSAARRNHAGGQEAPVTSDEEALGRAQEETLLAQIWRSIGLRAPRLKRDPKAIEGFSAGGVRLAARCTSKNARLSSGWKCRRLEPSCCAPGTNGRSPRR
jgi:hypothetical protein